MQEEKKYKGASNPARFDQISKEVFAPIYPMIAQQILDRTQQSSGNCLDAGCGTGALGRSIAKLSDLHVTYFDQSPEMIDFAMSYVSSEDLIHKSNFLVGDIHRLPIADATMDLVISRGSCPFWDNWDQAYSEICRVLKDGGHAYIGGGFGSAQLREQIHKTMSTHNPEWQSPFKNKMADKKSSLDGILKNLPVFKSSIINDESGFWVHIIK